VASYVLDASVLAALYVNDPATEQSEAVLERIDRDELHAPDFVVLEVPTCCGSGPGARSCTPRMP